MAHHGCEDLHVSGRAPQRDGLKGEAEGPHRRVQRLARPLRRHLQRQGLEQRNARGATAPAPAALVAALAAAAAVAALTAVFAFLVHGFLVLSLGLILILGFLVLSLGLILILGRWRSRPAPVGPRER